MDTIEMQITSAIERMPWLEHHQDEHKNGTSPLESPPTSPKSGESVPTIRRKYRPSTRDSTQSNFSVDSGGANGSKKPVSIIGALHEGSVRRGLGSILDSDQVSNADRLMSHNRLDSISQRVASIQAKVRKRQSGSDADRAA